MTVSKMKKEAERELYKAALEYHAVALDNIMERNMKRDGGKRVKREPC